MCIECDPETDALVDELIASMKDDERIWGETVQVGDWVDSWDDGFYTFSDHQYKTKGKLYQVREVDIRPHSISVIVDGDYLDPAANGKPEKVWMGASKVIVRNGKVIWESHLEKAIKALPPDELKLHNHGREDPLVPFVLPEILPV
jgi:hypothetical protein